MAARHERKQMAREATREERIYIFMQNNKVNRYYAEAFVDGLIAIEIKDKQMKIKPVTREEAISRCHGISHPETLVQALEALGLIEFKPKQEIKMMLHKQTVEYGTIRVEEWPEGLVVWVGGSIVYKSWEGNKSRYKLAEFEEVREAIKYMGISVTGLDVELGRHNLKIVKAT